MTEFSEGDSVSFMGHSGTVTELRDGGSHMSAWVEFDEWWVSPGWIPFRSLTPEVAE